MLPPFPILFSSNYLHNVFITMTQSLTFSLVLCSRELFQDVKYKSLFLLKTSGKMLKCIAGGFLFTIYLFLRLALIHKSLFYNL